MAISKGQFEAELNDIEKLLRKLDFFEERNFYPNTDLDPSVYRSKSYLDNWKSLIADNIFSFMLSDNSILNFNFSTSKFSFVYFECPYVCSTYKEFLKDNDLEDDYQDRLFNDYYEIYLQQCELKDNPVMIRYDLDANSYFHGLHPTSHIHIGHKNQIRLGTKKILKPKSFISFILRQNYPAMWRTIISSENEWKSYFIREKDTLTEVSNVNWNLLDQSEFHLH